MELGRFWFNEQKKFEQLGLLARGTKSVKFAIWHSISQKIHFPKFKKSL